MNEKHHQIESAKILVAYFSHTGNTKKIAKQIQNITNGDIFEIQPVMDYPNNYNEVTALAKQEIQSGARPELKANIDDFEKYEFIFLGFPNWWDVFPAPVLTFLTNNDFSGKTIIPFCTHGGGGSGHSFKDIAKHCPETKVLNDFTINGYAVEESNPEVSRWINKIMSSINK